FIPATLMPSLSAVGCLALGGVQPSEIRWSRMAPSCCAGDRSNRTAGVMFGSQVQVPQWHSAAASGCCDRAVMRAENTAGSWRSTNSDKTWAELSVYPRLTYDRVSSSSARSRALAGGGAVL